MASSSSFLAILAPAAYTPSRWSTTTATAVLLERLTSEFVESLNVRDYSEAAMQHVARDLRSQLNQWTGHDDREKLLDKHRWLVQRDAGLHHVVQDASTSIDEERGTGQVWQRMSVHESSGMTRVFVCMVGWERRRGQGWAMTDFWGLEGLAEYYS